MAIKKVVSLAVSFIGDGSATTLAFAVATDSFVACAQTGKFRGDAAVVNPAVTTGTAVLPGVTANGIPFTGTASSGTITLTFATAPPVQGDSAVVQVTT